MTALVEVRPLDMRTTTLTIVGEKGGEELCLA